MVLDDHNKLEIRISLSFYTTDTEPASDQEVISPSPPEASPAVPLGALVPNEVDETTRSSVDIF